MRRRSHQRHPVFQDARHRRARVLKILATLSAFTLLTWVTAFATGIYYIDILPENAKLDHIRLGTATVEAPAAPGPAPECVGDPLAATDLLAAGARAPVSAYLRVVPPGALTALAGHCQDIDGVLAEWLRIDAATQTAEWLGETEPAAALSEVRQNAPDIGIELVAVLAFPAVDDGGTAVLDQPAARARIATELAARVAGGAYAGACLYPAPGQYRDLTGLRALLAEVGKALPDGVTSCLVTDADGTLWRDAGLVAAVDTLVLRGFSPPGPDTPPGPLAPQAWFEALLADALAAVGPDKLRLALGSLAYRWTDGVPDPAPLSFAEAMRLAHQHQAVIETDPATLNTRIAFTDADGRRSEIWALDAVSIHNQLQALGGQALAGIALWGVGQEDPGVWTLLRRAPALPPVSAIETVSFADQVVYAGDGPFRRIAETAAPGQRRFFHDPATGLITGQAWDILPRPVTVERYGARTDRTVALTFDDGPDPVFTADILDILHRSGVPATFFVVGGNMAGNPDIVRRMVAEGHEVGSHTFLHPEGEDLWLIRAQIELNAFQRLLAGVTGRTTYLFRTPYGRSEGPVTEAEATQQAIYETEGYVVAGADVVPRDWEGMTAGEIAGYVLAEVRDDRGQVIILHDAGGDRSSTVAALPLIIDGLRERGFRFVPLSAFLGLTRDEVMPIAADPLTPLDRASFATAAGIGHALVWVFWVAVVVGAARSSLVLLLALLRRRHPARLSDPPPGVTVAIPAYNEELVIAEAVGAALASGYPGLRVIVVDDGSTDDTAGAVLRGYGQDRRVRLIRQKNGGKWSALNAALAVAETEIIVAVDADTLLDAGAVAALAAHFADPRIGAVAGNVKVANRRGLLPRFQALEYITAQNIDRRAAERLNAIMVVPGAIGAWRTAALRKVGGYSPDTITEDADLTVSVLRAGYRVAFEERALSLTDAPETLPAFMKQRLRWSFGMMQTAWKHRRAARTARGVGLFTLPDLWLTGIGMGLLAPLADAVLIAAIAGAALDALQGQPPAPGDGRLAMILGWAILPLLDLAVALTAFRFERRERLSLLLLLPVQRVLYRPLLYITVYRAVGHALAGRIAAWGKLARSGGVGTTAR
ncbi:glycosyltransferase [Acidimangrovimonas sediminis]|uniref:Chitooligosaccharide deacetylase n=2 Tax=Albidovulum sediminis TaxID=3066345 RepID=A0ABT2NKU1_9RHOB|nr:glycosyltransferase [Defluviimonas sediminis]